MHFFYKKNKYLIKVITKAGHQIGKRSISAIKDAYFDTLWRGDISWYLDYD